MSPTRKRRAAFESLKNVFWAFLFAVALWLVMAQSEMTTRDVYVRFIVSAPGMNVSYGTARNQAPVERVTVRGTRTSLERLGEGEYEATYPVPATSELGPKTYAARDFVFHFPEGVDVDKTVLAREITVDLAKSKEDELAVEPNLVRDAPEGWEIESVDVEPKFVSASGSIEEMAKNPKLTTQPQVSVKLALERNDFDKHSGAAKEVEQKVSVVPPDGTGINILDKRPVTLRIRVKPKPKERELELSPAFHFTGPVFPGLPYRLRPALPGKDKVKVRVSGPENDLVDSQVEATKARFVVYVEIRSEDIPKGKQDVGKMYTFPVHVIPPPGSEIKVLSFDDNFRIGVDPVETETTPGGK